MNLLVLSANYYFLSLIIPAREAACYTLLAIGFFAIWYPNVCAKFYEELLIAQKMSPRRNETRVRAMVEQRIQSNKRALSRRFINWILLALFATFIFSIATGLYLQYFESIEISALRNRLSLMILMIIFPLRYWVAQFRIERKVAIFKKLRPTRSSL